MIKGLVIKNFMLRSAWLLLGAAIAIALVVVIGYAGGWLMPAALFVACLFAVPLGAALIGLLPGVRELEITAAQALLKVDADLVAPARPSIEHRMRTCLWTIFHAVSGLVAGFVLFGLVPAAVVVIYHGFTGAPASLDDLVIARWPSALQVIAGIASLGGILIVLWALGWLAARLAFWALGPTSGDRLALAEARLAAEAQQVALARELHDGIGHALSVISVQAAGGRRTLPRDPAGVGRVLKTIEDTARLAQEELDSMLAMLRGTRAGRTPEPDLTAVGELIETHRRLGQQIIGDLELDSRQLPALVSRTGYQVLAEGLGNAHTHAAPGVVELRLDDVDEVLRVSVSSPYARTRRPSTGGRGLAGLTERVSVLGGRIDAGHHDGRWVLDARLPHGRRK